MFIAEHPLGASSYSPLPRPCMRWWHTCVTPRLACLVRNGLLWWAGRASALERMFSSHKYGDSWEEWQPDEEAAVSNSSATLSLWGLRAREDALLRRESAEQREFFLFSIRCACLLQCCNLSIFDHAL